MYHIQFWSYIKISIHNWFSREWIVSSDIFYVNNNFSNKLFSVDAFPIPVDFQLTSKLLITVRS